MQCFMCGFNGDIGYHLEECLAPDGSKIHVCLDCLNRSEPETVCLCGSTRFFDEFAKANLELTLQGKIVLSIGCDTHHVDDQFTEEQKQQLDWLHKCKIIKADRILVLNVGGYIGPSTASEIAFAEKWSKPVEYKYGKQASRQVSSHEVS